MFNEQESDDDTDMFGEPKTRAKRPAAKSVTIADEVSSHNFRIKRNTNNNFTNNYVVNNSPRRKLRKRQLKRRIFSAASPQKPQRRRTSLVSSSFSRFLFFFILPWINDQVLILTFPPAFQLGEACLVVVMTRRTLSPRLLRRHPRRQTHPPRRRISQKRRNQWVELLSLVEARLLSFHFLFHFCWDLTRLIADYLSTFIACRGLVFHLTSLSLFSCCKEARNQA